MFLDTVFRFGIDGRIVRVKFNRDADRKWKVTVSSPDMPHDVVWGPPKNGSRPRRSPCMQRAERYAKWAIDDWKKVKAWA